MIDLEQALAAEQMLQGLFRNVKRRFFSLQNPLEALYSLSQLLVFDFLPLRFDFVQTVKFTSCMKQ